MPGSHQATRVESGGSPRAADDLEENDMNAVSTHAVSTHAVSTVVRVALAGLVLAAVAGPAAGAAVPDPGSGTGLPASSVPVASGSADRSLHRIGSQLVIGDNLTGNGVAAPCWVPELGAASQD
jgi:hypothetical protein